MIKKSIKSYHVKIFSILLSLIIMIFLSWFLLKWGENYCKATIINNWTNSQLKATEETSKKILLLFEQNIGIEKKLTAETEKAAVEVYLKNLNYFNGSYTFFYNKNYVIYEQNNILTSTYYKMKPKEVYDILGYNGGYHLDDVLKGIYSDKNGIGYFVKNHSKGPEHVTWVCFNYNNESYIIGIVTPEKIILNEYNFNNFLQYSYIILIVFILLIVILSLLLCNSIYITFKIRDKLKKEKEKKSELILELNDKLEIEKQKYKNLSIYDPLTQMHNRKFFDAFIKKVELKIFIPVTILITDINGLKLINNTFGYNVGDIVLIETANILTSLCRDTDLVARYGNDEFAVIMTNTEQSYAEGMMKNFTKLFNNRFEGEIPVTISFGVATKNNREESVIIALELAESNMNLNKINEETSIKNSTYAILQKALHERTLETSDHCDRVKTLAVKIGEAMHLSKSAISELVLLSGLHDVGKIAIADKILNKSEALEEDEYEVMKTHSEIGYNIAMSSQDLRPIAKHILQHHERWDGKGYPQGLKGSEISLQARIISLVDSFDAMVNNRVYNKPKSLELALKEVERNAGSQFDPDIAAFFIKLMNEEN